MFVPHAERPIGTFPDPVAADHVTYNPSDAALRSLAATAAHETAFGAPAFVSDARSRQADRTENAVDDAFDADDWALVEEAIEAANDPGTELLCLDRRVGRHPEAASICRYFVPKDHARIALAWGRLLEPVAASAPDFVTIQLPDSPEPRIRVLPEAGVTCVLGTDYTGEAKKSFLRLFMYRAKERGGLGLHAGSKRVVLDDRTVGQVFLGLSGTGKTTLTGHGYGLAAPEAAELLQDDVCALLSDGTVAGSEGAGLYVKTFGLAPDEQPELHRAATRESAVLENVAVRNGRVDFDDDRHTRNGRAVVRREHLPNAADDVDLDRVDQLFFITRNPLVPPIVRLDADQAAAAFVLGESIETSAGDPERAGEPVRVVGTNPFIVGPEGEEGNRFHDLVSDLDVDCFLLNTGSVGDRDVGVGDTVTILREVARGRVAWTRDERLELVIPERVPGLDVEAFYPPDRVDDFERRLAALREERREYLAGLEDLRPAIGDAVL